MALNSRVLALSTFIMALAICHPAIAQLEVIGVVTDGDIASLSNTLPVTAADAFNAFNPLLVAMGGPSVNVAAAVPNVSSSIASGVSGLISPFTWTPLLGAIGVEGLPAPDSTSSAAEAFNALLNNAVGNVTSSIIQSIFFTPAGVQRALLSAVEGLPADAAGATPVQLQRFVDRYLRGLLDAQQQTTRVVGRVAQQGTRAAERYQQQTEKACADWALSRFLRAFADILLALGQPYGNVYDLLGQVVGIVFSGQSVTGQQYLDAFCCDLIKKSGLDLTLASVNLAVGNAQINLNTLVSMLIAGNYSGIEATFENAFTRPPSPAALAAPPSPSSQRKSPPARKGAQAPPAPKPVKKEEEEVELPPQLIEILKLLQPQPGQCNVVEWIVYALKNDKQLAIKVVQLFKALKNLAKRLLVAAIRKSSRLGANAAGELVGAQNQLSRQVLSSIAAIVNAAGH